MPFAIATPQGEEINGTTLNDILAGLGGDDFIFAGDGDDKIYGDDGNDELNGARGSDLIFGGADNDEVRAGDGDDELYGNDGQIDFKVAVVQTSFMAGLGMISSLVKMVTTYFLVMVETTN